MAFDLGIQIDNQIKKSSVVERKSRYYRFSSSKTFSPNKKSAYLNHVLKENVQINIMNYSYKGKHTIFINRDAALKKCEDIYNSLGKNEKFFDTEFGSQKNNPNGSKMSLYWKGNPPKG